MSTPTRTELEQEIAALKVEVNRFQYVAVRQLGEIKDLEREMEQTLEEYMQENYTGMTDYDMNGQYLEMLNEETVTICGMEYSAGYALREVDPIAFGIYCGV